MLYVQQILQAFYVFYSYDTLCVTNVFTVYGEKKQHTFVHAVS